MSQKPERTERYDNRAEGARPIGQALADALAAGRGFERAAVVAWLRAFEPSSGATITDDLARLIERGEHVK